MDEKTIHLDEINLHSVLLDLVRKLWVVILAVVCVLMCLFAYEKRVYVPQYTSTATFMVSVKGDDSAYTSLSMTQEMAQVFSEVFQSSVLWEKVEEQMGKSFDGYITTDTITETNLMVVSVTSTSPEKSFRALNLIIENYPTISELVFGNAILAVIKAPVVPVAPSNSFNTRRYQQFGILAAVLAIAAIVLSSIMRDTVQTPTAAKRKLDGKFLRSIRHEEKNKTLWAKVKRKNIVPLISNPLIGTGFREDNLSFCSIIEYHMRRRGQKVIMICSAGENEGKSTVAANLALSMAAENKQVMLLDCDFRKPALQKIFELEIDQEHDFGYYISHENSSPDFLIHLAKQGPYVGANASGFKHARRMVASPRLRSYIAQARECMDYIIIDSPPMLATADTDVLAQLADVSVLVVREDCVYAKDINNCMDILRRSTSDAAGFVLNNYHPSVTHFGSHASTC